jgi:hypothetical protein
MLHYGDKMTEIILFTFGTIGMTHIIVDGTIFEPVRNYIKSRSNNAFFKILDKIVMCNQCMGFWSGVFCGMLVFKFGLLLFVAGCAGSFFSNFSAIYMNYLETQMIITLDKEKSV